MVPDCPEMDTLASVAAAFDWDVPAAIDHVASCPQCRATLHDLSALQGAFRDLPEVDLALLENPALAPREPARARPSRGPRLLLAGATFVVVTVTTMAALLMLAGSPRDGASTSWVVLGTLSALVGAVVAWRPERGGTATPDFSAAGHATS